MQFIILGICVQIRSLSLFWVADHFVNYNSHAASQAQGYSNVLDGTDCQVEDKIVTAEHVENAYIGKELDCGRVCFLLCYGVECLTDEVC